MCPPPAGVLGRPCRLIRCCRLGRWRSPRGRRAGTHRRSWRNGWTFGGAGLQAWGDRINRCAHSLSDAPLEPPCRFDFSNDKYRPGLICFPSFLSCLLQTTMPSSLTSTTSLGELAACPRGPQTTTLIKTAHSWTCCRCSRVPRGRARRSLRGSSSKGEARRQRRERPRR